MHDAVKIASFAEPAKETFEAKMRYILKMRNKPEDPNTAPKNELDYIKSITL